MCSPRSFLLCPSTSGSLRVLLEDEPQAPPVAGSQGAGAWGQGCLGREGSLPPPRDGVSPSVPPAWVCGAAHAASTWSPEWAPGTPSCRRCCQPLTPPSAPGKALPALQALPSSFRKPALVTPCPFSMGHAAGTQHVCAHERWQEPCSESRDVQQGRAAFPPWPHVRLQAPPSLREHRPRGGGRCVAWTGSPGGFLERVPHGPRCG